MMNHGTPHSGNTNSQDTFTALVRAEAQKSGVGIRHLEGPAELARRVLLKRGVTFSHQDSLSSLVTKLTQGVK